MKLQSLFETRLQAGDWRRDNYFKQVNDWSVLVENDDGEIEWVFATIPTHDMATTVATNWLKEHFQEFYKEYKTYDLDLSELSIYTDDHLVLSVSVLPTVEVEAKNLRRVHKPSKSLYLSYT
jgi:hypothetical protein